MGSTRHRIAGHRWQQVVVGLWDGEVQSILGLNELALSFAGHWVQAGLREAIEVGTGSDARSWASATAVSVAQPSTAPQSVSLLGGKTSEAT